MRVEAAEVAAPHRQAVTIEEFEDLDRHLAAVLDAVAELRRGELALGAWRDRSATMPAISATVARVKKWSCATWSTRPERPTSLQTRRTSVSGTPSSPAMSRTRGGRNRSSCFDTCGAMRSHSASSAGESRATWPAQADPGALRGDPSGLDEARQAPPR